MKKGYINKLLYQTRLDKKLDRKQASKLLHVSSLYLKLVEIGYLSVSKKKQKKFIKGYGLDKDFFKTNSNYIVTIEKPKEKVEQVAKAKKFISQKWVRYTSLGLAVANIVVISYGVYAMHKNDLKPRDKWTEEFYDFRKGMEKEGKQSPSILYPGETKYTVEHVTENTDGIETSIISTYSNDSNAVDTNLDSTYVVKTAPVGSEYIEVDGKFSFAFFAYNKKICAFCKYQTPSLLSDKISVPLVTATINAEDDYSFREFDYKQNGQTKRAKKGSKIYKDFTKIFSDYLDKAYYHFDDLFQDSKYQGKLGYLFFTDLIHDLQKISRDYVLHFRLGIWVTVLGAIFGIGFTFLMSLSFYFFYKHKKKNRYTTITQQGRIPSKVLLSSNDKYYRDIKFKLFIPEFVLTIVGIVILSIAAIATIITTHLFFQGEWIDLITLKPYKDLSTNMLAAGIMLLMLVKLDTYSNKSIRQLVISIFGFLLGGIAFYVFELVLFRSFTNTGSIFALLIEFLKSIIPGNFIWPLGLFAAIFLFLFTEPMFTKKEPHKLTVWRSMATIPTVLMLFSLFWKFLISPNVYAPDWITFLFYSKGAVLTAFMLLYIYGMFLWRRYCQKQIGYNYSKYVFFNSKRYLVQKNIIASSLLTILLAVDLIFRFTMPNNKFDLGNSWAMGIIIPFVLFYHPHIGKRNAAWDNSATVMNTLASAGGYIGAVIYVLVKLNFGEIFYIIN